MLIRRTVQPGYRSNCSAAVVKRLKQENRSISKVSVIFSYQVYINMNILQKPLPACASHDFNSNAKTDNPHRLAALALVPSIHHQSLCIPGMLDQCTCSSTQRYMLRGISRTRWFPTRISTSENQLCSPFSAENTTASGRILPFPRPDYIRTFHQPRSGEPTSTAHARWCWKYNLRPHTVSFIAIPNNTGSRPTGSNCSLNKTNCFSLSEQLFTNEIFSYWNKPFSWNRRIPRIQGNNYHYSENVGEIRRRRPIPILCKTVEHVQENLAWDKLKEREMIYCVVSGSERRKVTVEVILFLNFEIETSNKRWK